MAGDIMFGGNHFEMAVAPAPMAEALVTDYPEVESACRFRNQGSYLVKKDEENIKEEDVIFADNSVFKVFTIPLLQGNPENALINPNALTISESAAIRHFGDEDPMGKQLVLDNDELYEITGVFEDMPKNSHFHFDFIVSLAGNEDAKVVNWLSNNYQTYFVLAESTDQESFATKFEELVQPMSSPRPSSF